MKKRFLIDGAIIGSAFLVSAIGVIFALPEDNPHVYTSQNEKAPTHELFVNWPAPESTLTENQRFIVRIEGAENDEKAVRVFWKVEHGLLRGEMEYDGENYFSEIDVSKWDWKKDGAYHLGFIATDASERLITATAMLVYAGGVSQAMPQTAVQVEQETVAETPLTAAVMAALAPVQVAPTPPLHSAPTPAVLPTSFRIEWTPAPARHAQTFTFHTEGYDANRVQTFWKAEGGHANMVYRTDAGKAPSASINLFGWQWKGEGPYRISFILADAGTSAEIAKEELEMRWVGKPGESEIRIVSTGVKTTQGAGLVVQQATPPPQAVQPTATPAPAPTPVATPAPSGGSTGGTVGRALAIKLFAPEKPAVAQTLTHTLSSIEREALQYIVRQPSAVWLNGDGHDANTRIEGVLARAKETNAVPAFVLYNIPNRDCGSHSSGGARNAADYRAWVDRLAGVFSGKEALVIVEPDALAQLNCVSGASRDERLALIRYATERMASASPRIKVYIDAGHPFWVNAEEVAQRLRGAGVASARGFSLNVSNYASTQDNIRYGTHVSNLLGGAYFIIDTSRNGNGQSPTREWCNPSGRALGQSPALLAGAGYLDAFLWVKFPGESDGACNGGPSAGAWWKEYAVSLYTNRAR